VLTAPDACTCGLGGVQGVGRGVQVCLCEEREGGGVRGQGRLGVLQVEVHVVLATLGIHNETLYCLVRCCCFLPLHGPAGVCCRTVMTGHHRRST
jgi:hypothetical protein